MDDCLQRLIDRIDSDESLKTLTPSDCVSKLIRIRLEMQAPYISTWPQALSIQVSAYILFPSQKLRSLDCRAGRVFDKWFHCRHNQSMFQLVLSRGQCLWMRSGMLQVIMPLTLIGMPSALSWEEYTQQPRFICWQIALLVCFSALPFWSYKLS